MGRARYDVNNKPTLTAVSNVDGVTPIELWADPGSHALVTQGGGGGGSATVVGIGPVGQNNTSYDTIQYTNTSTTVDTYTYKTGGTGGTTVATVTITYIDTTKNQVSSVVRT